MGPSTSGNVGGRHFLVVWECRRWASRSCPILPVGNGGVPVLARCGEAAATFVAFLQGCIDFTVPFLFLRCLWDVCPDRYV